jgi:hypothetical protein
MSDQDVIREALRRSETFEARSASEAFNALERLSAALETAQRQVEDVTRYWNASIDEREGLERALEAAQRSSQEWHDAAEAQRTGRLEAERERDTLKAALEQILSYKVRTTYTATLMQTDAREALAAARETEEQHGA